MGAYLAKNLTPAFWLQILTIVFGGGMVYAQVVQAQNDIESIKIEVRDNKTHASQKEVEIAEALGRIEGSLKILVRRENGQP